jgi:hypothetical protein
VGFRAEQLSQQAWLKLHSCHPIQPRLTVAGTHYLGGGLGFLPLSQSLAQFGQSLTQFVPEENGARKKNRARG